MFFFPITPAGRARQKTARQLYTACVEQSRRPEFYLGMAVPDTFDGRFELTSLHAGMVVNRLAGQGPQGLKLAQSLFDVMFLSMELNIREIGVGDLAVPRHIKRMMTALKGRAMTYKTALAQGLQETAEALARNLYGTAERPSEDVLQRAAMYMAELERLLAAQDFSEFTAGRVTFPQPPAQGVTDVEKSKVA